jgi:small GTP-binding protein
MKKKIINRKIVILGESSVGKTSIVNRLIDNEFKIYNEPTIGASYSSIILEKDNYKLKLDIWDTAGQEKYRSLTPLYYRNTDYALIVFDLTKKESYFESINWINEITEKSKNSKIILIGNKSDIKNKENINPDISIENIKSYLEVSAKDNNNIQEILNVINNLDEEDETSINNTKTQTHNLAIDFNKDKPSCCFY